MHDELADARLEREIEHAKSELDRWAGKDPMMSRAAWLKLKDLVAQRSDAHVDAMERRGGLQ